MTEFTTKSGPEPESSLWMKRAAQFPKATNVPFATFNNRYTARTCCVVGRGVTDFSYPELGTFPDPIFFINDAVCMEKHARTETFFFAHDARMLVWLDGAIRATAVLPLDGKLFLEQPEIGTASHRQGRSLPLRGPDDRKPVLRLNRQQVAADAELYRHSATIHSLLHFVWFCGFKCVVFIGCDGLNDAELLGSVNHAPTGYDPRLDNRSRTAPWWQYGSIRSVQDRLCSLLGLETRYVGTPRPSDATAIKKYIFCNPREWVAGNRLRKDQ